MYFVFSEEIFSVPAASRSNTRDVFTRSGIGIMGSNPTRGMDILVFFLFVLFCVGSSIATIQGIMSAVCKIQLSELILNGCTTESLFLMVEEGETFNTGRENA
jgi:hypothetical protein